LNPLNWLTFGCTATTQVFSGAIADLLLLLVGQASFGEFYWQLSQSKYQALESSHPTMMERSFL
jgi:hypothetical protein